MEQWITKAHEVLLNYGPSAVAAVVILVIGYLVAKTLTGFARRMMRKAKLDGTLISFVSNLLYMLLITLVVLASLNKLGVDTTTFAAVMAATGLAIGLALQGSLGNFAAGVMLIALRPFKVGDFIEAAGVDGTVEDITVFATKLRTTDNKSVIVPNGNVFKDAIANYSTKDTRRVDMVFGIGYDDDIRKAKELFESVLADHPLVLKDPAPQVAVSELGDSSVNFVVRPWCKTPDYFKVKFDVLEQIKLGCDANGISIPFPQRDVHLHQVA